MRLADCGGLFRRGVCCVLVGAFALLAVACNDERTPHGQVVAVVNGVEITLPELNEESRIRGLAIGQDRGLRDALLGELVDRKLLVKEAIEQGFDKSPDYLLSKRRADEIMLAQNLLADAAQAWTPSNEEVARFIATSPHIFDNRRVLAVDQIVIARRVPEPLLRTLMAQLDVRSMAQLLARSQIKAMRSTQQWDSAALSREWATTVMPLAPDANFVLRGTNRAIVGKILAVVPQPVPPSQRDQVARQALIHSRAEMILARIVEGERSKADIRFQPAFAPGAALHR